MNIFHKHSQAHHPHKPSPTAGFFRRIGTDAYVDWTVTVVVSFMAVIAFALVGYGVYSGIDAGTDDSAAIVSTRHVPIDAALLDKTVKDAAARAAEHGALMKGYSGPDDPSL
jgi:hypothetical protein